MALSSTYAVRLGSIAAGVVWIVLLVAPGSRADHEERAEPGVAAARYAGDVPTIVESTVTPSTTAPPTTIPSTTVPTPATPPTTVQPAAPAASVAPVYSLRDVVGVRIDRGATWIAIATVTTVDQTGAPAAGVEVEATWGAEATPASCRTDSAGKCSMYRSGLPANVDSTTITITAPQHGVKTIGRDVVN